MYLKNVKFSLYKIIYYKINDLINNHHKIKVHFNE